MQSRYDTAVTLRTRLSLAGDDHAFGPRGNRITSDLSVIHPHPPSTTGMINAWVAPPSAVGRDLGMSVRDVGLTRLRGKGLNAKEVAHHSSLRRASVLVLLVDPAKKDDSSSNQEPWEPCVLLTQRSMHLRSHPGQVCFPGGKQDAVDHQDDIATALRETEEEIGLDASKIEILCRLRTIESLHHLCVTPIVGYIQELQETALTLYPTEVAAAFRAPLGLFLEPPLRQTTVAWSEEEFVLRHYEYKQPSSGQVFAITGLTAHIAHQVAQIVYNPSSSDQPTSDQSLSFGHTGHVWMKQPSNNGRQHYWSRRFLVMDQQSGVLHLYDHSMQARRKAHSANKKHRIALRQHKGHVTKESGVTDPLKWEFRVSVLDGQVEWHLAVSTEEERFHWLRVIEQEFGKAS